MTRASLIWLASAALLALPAAAAPDLRGKSPEYVAAYQAAYERCTASQKKSAGATRAGITATQACEQLAQAEAAAATAKPTAVSPLPANASPSIQLGAPSGIIDASPIDPDKPPLVLTQEDLAARLANAGPDGLILTIPLDFENFPTEEQIAKGYEREYKGVYLGLAITYYRHDSERSSDGYYIWKRECIEGSVPACGHLLQVKLDYPAGGTVKDEIRMAVDQSVVPFAYRPDRLVEIRVFANLEEDLLDYRTHQWDPGARSNTHFMGVVQNGEWILMQRACWGCAPPPGVTLSPCVGVDSAWDHRFSAPRFKYFSEYPNYDICERLLDKVPAKLKNY